VDGRLSGISWWLRSTGAVTVGSYLRGERTGLWTHHEARTGATSQTIYRENKVVALSAWDARGRVIRTWPGGNRRSSRGPR
jgi:hypothetical protein